MNLSTQKPVLPASLDSNTFSNLQNYREQALSLDVASVVPFLSGTAIIDGTSLSFDGLGNTEITAGATTGALNLLGIPATSIGNFLFDGLTNLTSLKLPNCLNSIGNYAFSECIGLKGSLKLPNSLTNLGSFAFYKCSGFNDTLKLPNSLNIIGEYSFNLCSGFTSLTLPNSATTIENDAFSGCSGLSGSLTIPNYLTTIQNGVFYGCSGFTGSLTLPNSVTSIGNYAFTNCTGITKVYANVNASVVNSGAFGGSGVTIIYYQSSKTGWTNPWNGIATAVWNNYPNSIPN